MKIIGIETSSNQFSLCIHNGTDLLYEVKTNRSRDSKSRDGRFFPEAEYILERFSEGKFGAVVVSIGPGMFTSLRIGLSLAKGLVHANKVPLIAINTLDIIGMPLSLYRYPALASINAFHHEVYVALYKNGTRISDYALMEVDDAAKAFLGQVAVIAGSGAVEMLKVVGQGERKNVVFTDDEFLQPSASKAVSIALPRIEKKQFDDPELLEPFYIKKTDAERNYDKTHATG